MYNRKHFFEEIYKNYWKGKRKQSTYKGKPTRRYLKYLEIEKSFFDYEDKCNQRLSEVIHKLGRSRL